MTLRSRLLAASAGCLAAAAAVYLVAVRTATGQAVENVAMDGHPEDEWWRVRPVADRLGVVASLLAAAGVVAVVAWAWRRGSWRRALAVAAAIGTAVALAEVLKLAVASRPALVAVGERAYLGPNTFPSGHSAAAVAVAVAAVALAPAGRRLPVALAGGAYAALVGMVLMAGEAHRPADAVGAALVTMAVGLTAVALADPPAAAAPGSDSAASQAPQPGGVAEVALADPPAPGSDPAASQAPEPGGVALVAVLVGLAAVAGLALAVALWVVAVAVAHGPLTGAEVDAARVLGFVAVAVASLAAVLGFAWLTRGVRLAT